MAKGKVAGEFTVACRELFKKHGLNLSYKDARPLLKEMGVKVVKSPGRVSEKFSQFWAVAKDYNFQEVRGTDQENQWYEELCRKAGLQSSDVAEIRREHSARLAWQKQQTLYDVNKHTYRKSHASGVVSRKPATSKRGRKPAASKQLQTKTNAMEAVKYVLENGGVEAVQGQVADLESKIAEMTAEVERLQAVLAAAAEASKMLHAA